ncbi:MAG: DegT/DnrJ/EryC1/StrS family aminotransferase [Deltaproteobacteria bacterium]|nr:DegT/DnrJ/EryC1/StrS family aminotransferase [Deltaproteobacteria bacterium]
MTSRQPRIVLIGRTYLALCALERLLERGENVVAFVGQEGGDERDFCAEMQDVCGHHTIAARSARKLGEEIVRWLEDRIRPDLAISVGTSFEIPLAIGGNCRLGLIELLDSGRQDGSGSAHRVSLRQRGQQLLVRDVPESADDDEHYDEELVTVDAMLELLEQHLNGLRGQAHSAPASVPFERATLAEHELHDAADAPEAGDETARLEAELCRYVGGERALALPSVRETFIGLMRQLGIGEGHEVVCSPLSSGAALDAVRATGARTVLCDVQADCLTLDPARIPELLNENTRALLVSHPWGQPAELDALYGLAAEAGIELIEDATAALGARFESSRIGRSPCTTVFRMPLAPLSPGSAPALLTLPDALAERMTADPQTRRIGDGIASLALRRLESWETELSARREVASHYSSELVRYDAFRVPPTPPERMPTYAGYVLQLTRFSRTSAEDLHKLMAQSGIETRMLHLRADSHAIAELPVAEHVRSHALMLPCHPALKADEVEAILDALFGYAIG